MRLTEYGHAVLPRGQITEYGELIFSGITEYAGILINHTQTIVPTSIASTEAFGYPAITTETIVKPISIGPGGMGMPAITTSYTINVGTLVRPTGHTDSTAWSNEANAYDTDTATYASETIA